MLQYIPNAHFAQSENHRVIIVVVIIADAVISVRRATRTKRHKPYLPSLLTQAGGSGNCFRVQFHELVSSKRQ